MKKENQIAVVKNTLAIHKVENLISITEKLLKKEFSHCIYINHERAQIARLINNNVHILTDCRQEHVPLAIAYTKKGSFYLGMLALHRSGSCIEFLRTLGTGHDYHFPNVSKTYSSTELLTEFLKYLCSLETDTKITNSLIVIPDSFDDLEQINEFRKVAILCNLSNISFIHESIAIQNYYENNLTDTNDFNIVLSINKTNSTVTLIRSKSIVVSETNNYWGGDNIDYLIADKIFIPYLKDNFEINTLVEDDRKLNYLRNRLQCFAEEVKFNVSSKRKYWVLTDHDQLGNDDNGEEMELDLGITEDDLLVVLKDDFQNLINRINEVIIRNNLSIKQISKIYLSGANTRFPLLKNMLSESFIEPKIYQENHNAVIIGGTLLINEINTAGNNV